jgi:hypothetical protein
VGLIKRKNKNMSDKVKLISAEGQVFEVDRSLAMFSGTIQSMLSGAGDFFIFCFTPKLESSRSRLICRVIRRDQIP